MLIFVYGSLMRDGDNYDKMQRAGGKFQFPAETLDKYLKGDNGWWSYLIDDDDTPEIYKSIIGGEVFEVPDDMVKYLDAFEDPLERKEIIVEFENYTYKVWCYFDNV
jgi:gamma-glutamylcyclotransferase (GGCT)/AIG2-like uncharacterized protein YtfP